MAKRRWIQSANIRRGAFTRKATHAGMSVADYAAHVRAHPASFSTETRRQANLAHTFEQIRHRHHRRRRVRAVARARAVRHSHAHSHSQGR